MSSTSNEADPVQEMSFHHRSDVVRFSSFEAGSWVLPSSSRYRKFHRDVRCGHECIRFSSLLLNSKFMTLIGSGFCPFIIHRALRVPGAWLALLLPFRFVLSLLPSFRKGKVQFECGYLGDLMTPDLRRNEEVQRKDENREAEDMSRISSMQQTIIMPFLAIFRKANFMWNILRIYIITT